MLYSTGFLQLHSDLDKGDGQVRYVLSGEGAMSIFSIDEDTGDIHTTKRLDREQQAYYTLKAQARDRNTNLPLEPESQFIIKVQDINDNEPKFLDGPYVARVAERSPVGEFRISFCLHIVVRCFMKTPPQNSLVGSKSSFRFDSVSTRRQHSLFE